MIREACVIAVIFIPIFIVLYKTTYIYLPELYDSKEIELCEALVDIFKTCMIPLGLYALQEDKTS